MQFPRDTMIVVPVVTAPSLLCEDMAGQLRSAGFTRVVEATQLAVAAESVLRLRTADPGDLRRVHRATSMTRPAAARPWTTER